MSRIRNINIHEYEADNEIPLNKNEATAIHNGVGAACSDNNNNNGAELRNNTLASIKPEISQALSSLLEELSVGEDSGISFIHDIPNNRNSFSRGAQPGGKYCRLCRTANRPN